MYDRVLFVKRANELWYVARLICSAEKPQRKRVLIERKLCAADPKPGDLSMSRVKQK